MFERAYMTLAVPAMFLVTGVILSAYALSVFFGVSTMGVLVLIMGSVFITYGARHFEQGLKNYRQGAEGEATPSATERLSRIQRH